MRNRTMKLPGKILLSLLAAVMLLPVTVSVAPAAGLPISRTLLSNGLVLLLREDHSLPFVTINLLVNCGSGKDPKGQEGLARLTAKNLILGTRERNAVTISEELDFMGAYLNTSAGKDYATVSLRVLKKDFHKGFEVFLDALLTPVFPVEELEKEIRKTLAAIASSEDEPGTVAEKAFLTALFPANPYGHPVEGTRESLPGITRDHVERFYNTFFRPNNAIMVVVGDISAEEVKAVIVPPLEKWQSVAVPDVPFNKAYTKDMKKIYIQKSITQANIIVGHAGMERSNPDYYTFSVMNYILGGGGFSSRLMEEVRNKKGLAYSVNSFLEPGKQPGPFQVGLQTRNTSAAQTISIVVKEMERMQKEPVSNSELEGAKKYLAGSFPMRFNTQAKMANLLANMEFYGLGLDYPDRYGALINGVTKEDVLRVARTYLKPDQYILVVVGDLKDSGFEAAP